MEVAGMVMTVQPIDACITHLKVKENDEIIYMSPDETLNQKMANTMSCLETSLFYADIIKESITCSRSFSPKKSR
jgi:tRNA G37 N-methylase TrmD